MEEILNDGTFRSLLDHHEKHQKTAEDIKATRARIKETAETTKKFVEELKEHAEERKRDELSQTQVISKLKEDLQELKTRSILEGKYQKKEAKAYLDAGRRVQTQQEKSKEQQIAELQERIRLEEKVHGETASFLERKQEELQEQTEYWDSKYEQDMEEKERQLEVLKSQRATSLARLSELSQNLEEVQDFVMREKRLIEAQAFAKDIQQKRTAAAICIQTAWRLFKKRKSAREKLRRLKKGAKRQQRLLPPTSVKAKR